jgi:putative addiction module component (TIGR02574 family)
MNKPLMDQLLSLSSVEKIDLIGELWDSIPPAELPPLTEAQFAELERRAAEHRKDPSRAIPAEEVVARLRARFE